MEETLSQEQREVERDREWGMILPHLRWETDNLQFLKKPIFRADPVQEKSKQEPETGLWLSQALQSLYYRIPPFDRVVFRTRLKAQFYPHYSGLASLAEDFVYHFWMFNSAWAQYKTLL